MIFFVRIARALQHGRRDVQIIQSAMGVALLYRLAGKTRPGTRIQNAQGGSPGPSKITNPIVGGVGVKMGVQVGVWGVVA